MNKQQGVTIPTFLYGTAWKEDETERLTTLALEVGFRGIDTANQRRHYHEAAVGQALTAALQRGLVTRDELFLQTKFTFLGGQDHRLPYDPKAPITTQVEQSLASSLEHLGVSMIDSYALHGPSSRAGLAPADWEAWRALEAIQERGQTRFLGVSNVSLEQLRALCDGAQVRPTFVQNRYHAVDRWDRDIRHFCAAHSIIYQGFSLLTANRAVFQHPVVQQLAQHYRRKPAQLIFRFALDIGMLPLTGTTDRRHMEADLSVVDFALNTDDVARLENVLVC